MKYPWHILPEEFLARLQRIVPQEKRTAVLNSFCNRKPTTFRANTLKISVDVLQDELEKEGFGVEKVPWYKDAFILTKKDQTALIETRLYKEGFLYLQSLSSMIPPLVLNPQPHEIILDITAAPGSKTTQMAAMMDNTGKIIANDTSRVRLYRLEANLTLQGVKNTEILRQPAQIIWKQYPEYFDKTLVDVPCSMEGRFFCEDKKSFQDWTAKKIKILSEEQKWILRSAISSTRPGGIIVYSTCTISPEENEGVIDWILKKEKDAIAIETIHIQDLTINQLILSWNEKKYNSEIAKTVRIFPTKTMEGFYIAKMKKLRSTIDREQFL